jgi:hypothetical protein
MKEILIEVSKIDKPVNNSFVSTKLYSNFKYLYIVTYDEILYNRVKKMNKIHSDERLIQYINYIDYILNNSFKLLSAGTFTTLESKFNYKK